MGLNDFARQVMVAFEEEIVPGFEDRLVLSSKAKVNPTDGKQMERAGDIVYRPLKYIATSNDGQDATNDFKEITDMVVPVTLGFQKHVARSMDAKELRDDLRAKRFGAAGAERLATDVNLAVMDTLCNLATVVVVKSGPATDFGDPSQCDSIFNQLGIPMMGRQLAYSSIDYNGLAKDLANRGTMNAKPTNAYERALIGNDVAGFIAHKLDYANICPVAGGVGITMSTLVGAANFHTPKATSKAATGEQANFDNRFQRITVSSTTGINPGDAFTIANVFAIHHGAKRSIGTLKTFRVVSIDGDGTHMVICPPIISAQGGTQAELDYQNVAITATAGNAALVFLNVSARPMNPFWIEDAVELLPGHYAVPEDVGLKVARATTKNGIEIVMTMSGDINNLKFKLRWDVFFGVGILQPEMVGLQLFNQS